MMHDPCHAIAPMLAALVDDEASAEESLRAEGHLAECGPCRALLAAEMQVALRLDAIALSAQIEPGQAAATAPERRLDRGHWPAVALVALALGTRVIDLSFFHGTSFVLRLLLLLAITAGFALANTNPLRFASADELA